MLSFRPMKRLLLPLLLVLCFFGIAQAQYVKVLSIAEQSGAVITSGVTSTTKVAKTFPGATVTIYSPSGSGSIATIYSASTGTIKANPFSASLTDATVDFFIAPGSTFDIRISGVSGGVTITPFTRSGYTAPGTSGIALALCGGTADTSLLAALSALGGTIEIPRSITCASNTQTISAALQIDKGGLLKPINSSQTITLSGPQIVSGSGQWQRFTNALSGQGTIVLQGDVWPDWWAVNTTPGTTDMAAAINAADASVCSGVFNPPDGDTVAAQGRVRFTTGIYRVNSTLTYRGAPWQGAGVNSTTIVRHGTSGATVDAVGTTSARRLLDISDMTFDGGSNITPTPYSTGTVYGLALGYNIRSYGALRRVKFSHFPSYGIYFTKASDDMSFYDVQVISCGNTDGFSGIKIANTVTDANDVRWYSLSLENNGAAGSGFGGGIDSTGAGVCKQWSFFGGLLQSNLGKAEVHFFGGSNINFYGTYIESEGTADILAGMSFDDVLGVGIHDVFLTAAGANTGSALKFVNGTKGVIDNIRSFDSWTTTVTLVDTGTVIQVTSLGALVPGTSVVSIASGALLNWPAKNSNGIFIGTQAAPATYTVAATMLAADLFNGLITATPNATGATHAYTLPTGTNMESAALFANNDYFNWTITNIAAAAADTITITANTDHTFVGNPIVQSANAATGGVWGNSVRFCSRRVSATVWVTYSGGCK